MRRFLVTATLVLVLGAGALPLQSAEGTKVDQDVIAKLIKQLGDDNFTTREEARKSLEKIGVPALEMLQKEVSETKDPEVKAKASDLIKVLQSRVESERHLKPTRVHLSFNDTPLTEALKDFSAKSGYQLVYNDDPAKLADRKITLDTGDVTFWEAFDLFCEKAGLTISAMKNQAGGQGGGFPGVPPIQVAPPIQLVPAIPARPVDPDDAPKGVVDAQDNADPEKEAEEKRKKEEEVKKAAEQAAEIKQKLIQIQVQVGGGVMPGFPGGMVGGQATRTIVLGDGKHIKLPTCYSGAARIRAMVPEFRKNPDGFLDVPLDFALEPRMVLQSIEGIRFKKAVDDGDRTLATADHKLERADDMINWGGGIMPFPGQDQGRGAAKVKIEKETKNLKELAGVADVKIIPEATAIFTVENILKAGGKSTEGVHGGTLQVLEVRNEKEGKYSIRVRVELPPDVITSNMGGVEGPIRGVIFPGGRLGGVQVLPVVPEIENQDGQPNAQLNDEGDVDPPPVRKGPRRPRPVAPDMKVQTPFKLFDDKGKEFKEVTNSHPTFMGGGANGNMVTEYRLLFEPNKDQGEASKLQMMGSKQTTIEIPFQFKDVPLS